MEELINKLKHQIIEQLNLEDVNVAEINVEEPLFDSGLGLDSIDALELIVLLDKEYGIKVSSPSEGQKAFRSIKSMAEFIQQNQK